MKGVHNAESRGGLEGLVADRWWLEAARGTPARSRPGMNASLPSSSAAWDLVGGHSSRTETGS